MTQNKQGRLWPWMVVGLLLSGVGLNIYMVVVAVRDPSFAVEQNYYQKALSWDKIMAQERVNVQLGWNIALQTKVVQDKGGRMLLQAHIQDKQGHTVPNTKIQVEAFHNARSQHRMQRDLVRTPQNLHHTTLPFSRKGIWLFHFTVSRGNQRFTQQIRREIKG